MATGKGRGSPLSVDLIAAGTKVQKGEVVVTSGLQQSAFPPGIPVGRVTSAKTRPGNLEQTVTMDLATDLQRLAFVKVLLWSPGS